MRLALTYIIILLSFLGCQKGEEDPAISLISRKARLTGTWDLYEMSSATNQSTQGFQNGVLKSTVNDTLITSIDYSLVYVFDRAGGYEFTEISSFPEDTTINRDAYTRDVIEDGNWEFTGGNGEPSKSQLLLMQTRREISESDQGSNVNISTTESPSSGIIYDIIKLSSDELKLQMSELESFGGGSMRNEHFLFFKKRE